MTIRITCIRKSGGYHLDPHHAIQSLGWTNEQNQQSGNSTRLEIYEFLEKNGKAYVRDKAGDVADVLPRQSQNGTKYVQTRADGIWKDNLLALPECR